MMHKWAYAPFFIARSACFALIQLLLGVRSSQDMLLFVLWPPHFPPMFPRQLLLFLTLHQLIGAARGCFYIIF
eukprot:c29393_g1_i1 orf=3-218(-)